MTDLTPFQREYGRRKLAEYDARKNIAYKNQVIALRDQIRLITGLGIRDLRRALREEQNR